MVKPNMPKSTKGLADDGDSRAIVHEVKRVGLLIDRYVDLELRVGDHLILYVSKSQA